MLFFRSSAAHSSSSHRSKRRGGISNWLWGLVLIAGVWAAHWGAERLSHPLKKLRKGWGFSAAAGGAIVGLAAASPEIGINTTSAFRGVADIGLGVMFGSNILAIPAMVTVAYFATRKRNLGEEHQDHEQHRREHLIRVDASAVTVQALPYLGILAIVALLTVPKAWRGLDPIDGWIMLGVYVLYLAQALLRGRGEREEVDWSRREIIMAVAGVLVLALGAYFTVRATENIVQALGISRIVGGLFITAPMAALPEVFATWSVARSGQVTPAVTSVIGDHAVTMTVAFLPLALVGVSVENPQIFFVNLVFVALVPILYAAFIWWGGRGKGFKRWQVATLAGTYAVYVAVMLIWVLGVFMGDQTFIQ